MVSMMVLCLLGVISLTEADSGYSYSGVVGRASGKDFATEGEGRITAIRVWEVYNSYITGLQLRYNYAWSAVYGRQSGEDNEMELFEGEAIVQVSGKFNTKGNLPQLIFVTNRGRTLIIGQPFGGSFNFYPTHGNSELLILSGRFDSKGITAIAAHWGPLNDTQALR